jgi:hypothetical protein
VTARVISSDGCACADETTMDMATIAAMEIAVIFDFEFMILAGPFCINLFSQCLYEQGNLSVLWRHRRGTHN